METASLWFVTITTVSVILFLLWRSSVNDTDRMINSVYAYHSLRSTGVDCFNCKKEIIEGEKIGNKARHFGFCAVCSELFEKRF